MSQERAAKEAAEERKKKQKELKDKANAKKAQSQNRGEQLGELRDWIDEQIKQSEREERILNKSKERSTFSPRSAGSKVLSARTSDINADI